MKVTKVEFMSSTNVGATISGVQAAVAGQNGVKSVDVDGSTGIVHIIDSRGEYHAVYPANVKVVHYDEPPKPLTQTAPTKK